MFLITGCARTYHVINPSILHHENKKTLKKDVDISYLYNVQNLMQNKPYERKENKKNIHLLSVRIENNSNSPITITKENFQIKTSSGKEIKIIDPLLYSKTIRQYSETFLLFYGLSGIGYEWGTVNGESYSKLTYSPLNLIIGIGNTIFAENSNAKQKKNLIENDIFNKTIHPHSSITGLIAVYTLSYPELNFFYFDTNL